MKAPKDRRPVAIAPRVRRGLVSIDDTIDDIGAKALKAAKVNDPLNAPRTVPTPGKKP